MTSLITPIEPTTDESHDSATEVASGSRTMQRVLLVLGLLLATVGGWSVAHRLSASEPAPAGLGPMESIDQSVFAANTGLWIEHVSLVGGGGIIQIRYRVLDIDKSQVIHDTVNVPRIITADGFEISFQRHEHSHERDTRLGSTDNEQLVNIGSAVKRGDKITVIIGLEELPGVVVQ